MCLHWHSTPAGLLVIRAALYNFLQFLGVSPGWVRAFSNFMGILFAVFMGISFEGVHNKNTLSVTVNIFNLLLLLAICCGFLICASGNVLGLFYILVHNGLLV